MFVNSAFVIIILIFGLVNVNKAYSRNNPESKEIKAMRKTWCYMALSVCDVNDSTCVNNCINCVLEGDEKLFQQCDPLTDTQTAQQYSYLNKIKQQIINQQSWHIVKASILNRKSHKGSFAQYLDKIEKNCTTGDVTCIQNTLKDYPSNEKGGDEVLESVSSALSLLMGSRNVHYPPTPNNNNDTNNNNTNENKAGRGGISLLGTILLLSIGGILAYIIYRSFFPEQETRGRQQRYGNKDNQSSPNAAAAENSSTVSHTIEEILSFQKETYHHIQKMTQTLESLKTLLENMSKKLDKASQPIELSKTIHVTHEISKKRHSKLSLVQSETETELYFFGDPRQSHSKSENVIFLYKHNLATPENPSALYSVEIGKNKKEGTLKILSEERLLNNLKNALKSNTKQPVSHPVTIINYSEPQDLENASSLEIISEGKVRRTDDDEGFEVVENIKVKLK